MQNNKIISSLFYKFTEKVLVKFIGFIIGVVLARLLDPDIFGVVAIITATVSLAQVFVDGGLNTALVQNKNVSQEDYSTVFYITFSLAAVLYSALFLATPAITHYYHIENYTAQFRVLTITLLFYAINSIQSAQLQRNMSFQKMLICQLITTIISGGLGVAFAYAGLGIWALIIYYLSHALLTCITYSFALRWYPRLVFSVARAKVLFNYGYKILLSSILCSLFANLRTFVIGRLYTTSDLAVYSRGDQVPSIIATSIDNSFTSVMLPAFSREQDDFSKIKQLVRKTISMDSFIIFPAMIGLATVAENMVLVLYTQKWISAAPFVQTLSLANITVAIFPICLSAIKAIGRSDVHLRLEIIRRCVMLGILFASLSFHSLIAIAIGWLISTIIDVFIIMIPVKKLFGYSLAELFYDIWKQLFFSLIMAICVLAIGRLPLSPLPLLILQILGGVIVYLGASLLFMPQILKTAVSLIRKK